MPKRKPTGYFTEGKGFDRTVHPTFNPQGLRISKKHSGNTPVMDARIEKRIAAKKAVLNSPEFKAWWKWRRTVEPIPKDKYQAFRTDQELYAKREGEAPWKKQPHRKDIVGIDYPKKPKREPKKETWDYLVTWKNTEGKTSVNVSKATSKTEAYNNAKKWPLFKEVIDARQLTKKEQVVAPVISKSTSQQWNDMAIEKRRNLVAKLDMNEKWAKYEFDDLPKFVQDTLYDITSGRYTKARVKKQLAKEGKLMEEYSKSGTTLGWEEWRKQRTKSKRKLHPAGSYVFLPPETSGSKPYRVIEDKGGLVKVAQWNFGMGRETVSEVPRHMIKGKAKAPAPHIKGGVSYNKATGWMRISFADIPPKEVRDGMKSQGFRYRPKSKTWAAKWNPEREKFGIALVGPMSKVNIKTNFQRKAEWAEEQAAKHHKESKERYERFRKELKTIPMGQPILVGHHSEKGHRAHLKRLDNQMKKSIEEKNIGEEYQRRAKRYRRKASGEPPGLIYRRIKKMEAEVRGWKRSLQRLADNREIEKTRPKYAKEYNIHADPQEEQRAKSHIANLEERLKIEREAYNATGGIAAEKLKLKPGDRVRTQIGPAIVIKVNPKTVKVKSQRTDWTLKLDKSNIYGLEE